MNLQLWNGAPIQSNEVRGGARVSFRSRGTIESWLLCGPGPGAGNKLSRFTCILAITLSMASACSDEPQNSGYRTSFNIAQADLSTVLSGKWMVDSNPDHRLQFELENDLISVDYSVGSRNALPTGVLM